MALPSSGAISLSQVNVELGSASNAAISMNNAAVRALFGVASGAISMSQAYGKSNSLTYTISTAQSNANLRTLCNNLGYAGTVTKVIVKINSTLSSTSPSTPALEIGSWPAGVQLIVEIAAAITGKGGAGGAGGTSAIIGTNRTFYPGSPGGPGGPAIKASSAISGGSIELKIVSGGLVYGGGGGGGGGGSGKSPTNSIINGGTGGTGAGPNAATAGVTPSTGGGKGGNGGSYSVVGQSGTSGGSGDGKPGGAGGAAGAAIQGSGNTTRSNWVSGSNYLGAIA